MTPRGTYRSGLEKHFDETPDHACASEALEIATYTAIERLAELSNA